MQGFIETEEIKAETAILVGLITKNQNERKTNEYLDELQFWPKRQGLSPSSALRKSSTAPRR